MDRHHPGRESGTEFALNSLVAGVPTLKPPIHIAIPTRHVPSQPAVADFNHDGRLGLLVSGCGTGDVAHVLIGFTD